MDKTDGEITVPSNTLTHTLAHTFTPLTLSVLSRLNPSIRGAAAAPEGRREEGACLLEPSLLLPLEGSFRRLDGLT